MNETLKTGRSDDSESLKFWGTVLILVVSVLSVVAIVVACCGCARVVDGAGANSQSTIANSQGRRAAP